MQRLEQVLSSYGIQGQVVAEYDGPLLKVVEFQPETGTKIKNVEAVADDVARELGVSSLRVSPAESSSYLNFEMPQRNLRTIDFMQIMQAADAVAGDLPMCLGADIFGRPVFADLAKMPHLLVGGTTGSGKSVGLNTFILSLMAAKSSDDLKFVLIDPKRIEFSVYDNQRYLLCPVVTETEAAVQVIAYLAGEMDRRYGVLEKSYCKNLKDYNLQNKTEKLPYIVCVIDEFADLTAADKTVEKNVRRLAQKARACGIHLILATQRPSVDVVTGVLKANFPTRLAYKTASSADSRTILDAGGAEKLIGRGDALFLSGSGELQRVHGAFVADEDIRKMLAPYRSSVKPLVLPSEKNSTRVEKKQAKDGWLSRLWKFWRSLRQKDRKLIVSGVLYVVHLLTDGKGRRR